MTRALLATSDQLLHDELLRLAAAAGAAVDVVHDPVSALRAWSGAPLVLLGADLAPELALLGPARRAGVHIVSWGRSADTLFRAALALGAEGVAELPDASTWLGEMLTDLDDSVRARGLTIGVVGGSGGAGATTLAGALGQLGCRSGPALVVDADPLGPGVDRVLGLEEQPGIHWGDLAQTTGRLGARSLREALPEHGGLRVLTWAPAEPRVLDQAVAREVLSAARRGHDTVVVDLPRAADPVAEELTGRCDVVVVVVSASVTGIASAARLVGRLPDRSRLRLVVRGRGADPDEVSRAVGVPVLAVMSDQRGLGEAIDLGLGPVRSRRGPLGRAAAEVLAGVGVRVGRADGPDSLRETAA